MLARHREMGLCAWTALAAQAWLLQAWLLQGLLQLGPEQLYVREWWQLCGQLLRCLHLAALTVLMGLLLEVCT